MTPSLYNPSFPMMRRKRQLLPEEETIALLNRGTSGVLAVMDGEYPYAVPVNYAYTDGKIIFHGAKKGKKIEALKNNPKVSFCVIDQDRIVPEEYTSYFRSAIAFGTVRILSDENEKREALDILAEKFRPGFEEERKAAIEREFAAVAVFVLDIEHLTGKEARELLKNEE